jgi:hypothetical protein
MSQNGHFRPFAVTFQFDGIESPIELADAADLVSFVRMQALFTTAQIMLVMSAFCCDGLSAMNFSTSTYT